MDKIFKSFADRQRRIILSVLKNQPMAVNEILGYLNITQATLSSHLANLKKAGLVECEIKGKKRIYKINYETLKNFVTELNRFIKMTPPASSDEIILRRKTV